MYKKVIAGVFLIIAILCSQNALADDGSRSALHPIEDRTGILYDKIIDYLDNMSVVQEKQHCVLAKGSKKTIGDNEAIEFDLIKLLVVYPQKKQRLAATATVFDPLGRRVERWAQALENGGVTKVRNTSPGNPSTMDREFDEKVPEDQRPTILVKGITPFDDAVRMTHGIDAVGLWHSGFAEELLLSNNLILDGADFDANGNVVSRWRNRSAANPVKVEIAFVKKFGYQPSLTRHYVKRGDRFVLWCEISTEWKLRGKTWLPIRHEAVELDFSGYDHHYIFEYQWKLGDEFAADLIPVGSNDWREPFRLLFKEEWARPGHGIVQMPEELQIPK